jgi:hypothetical protein
MLTVKTPSGFMLKIPAWMTRPEAESSALARKVTLPCSTLLAIARLLVDASEPTVSALSQPESSDVSERVQIRRKTTEGQASC